MIMIFNKFSMETPPIFAWALENKFYAAMMIFFLSNAVETQLVSTGAFEITVDNMPVWSKIESGRIPQPPELFQIVDTHLKMNTGEKIQGVCSRIFYCKVHDYLKSKSNNSSLKWMKIADSKYQGVLSMMQFGLRVMVLPPVAVCEL